MTWFRSLGPRLPVVLILASGLSVVLFRFFISVDGPMHVLHACVIKAEWFSQRFNTPTLTYVSDVGIPDAGDLILLPLTWLLPPYWAHACFCALVLITFGLGLLHLMRAYGAVDPWAFLLLLPFMHSFLLVMGFFTFLLALGTAFAFAGYWARSEVVNWKRLLWLIVGALLCASIHRSGAQVLLSLVLVHEIVLLTRGRATFRVRWAQTSAYLRVGLAVIGVAVVALLLLRILTGETHFEHAEAREPMTDLLRLRPLLLVDAVTERPFLLGFGVLLIALLSMAAWVRWRHARTWVPSDTLWICGLSALVLSMVVRGPYADLIYLVERLQFIGLLLLCSWLAITWRPSTWGRVLAASVLVVQIARVVFLEHRLQPLRSAYEAAMEVTDHLPAHAVALPVLCENNWVLDHLGAFVSIRYEGVFFSPHDHLGFRFHKPVSRALHRYAWGNRGKVPWLQEHLNSGRAPIIDHLVVLGHAHPRTPADSVILHMRDRYFTKQWENGYAEVWVRNDNRSH